MDFDVESLTHDATILPERVEGGLGIYRDDSVALAKEMRASDPALDVGYLHSPDNRTWRGLKGDVVGEIILALLTSGSVAALQSWLTARYSGGKVRIKIARVRRVGPDTSVEWLEAEGSGRAVAKALEALRTDDTDS